MSNASRQRRKREVLRLQIEGSTAYDAGVQRTKCPYREIHQSMWWHTGWRSAEMQALDREEEAKLIAAAEIAAQARRWRALRTLSHHLVLETLNSDWTEWEARIDRLADENGIT